jgi:CRP/FNR family cyclic AMP-dependent transcriptional regulator
MLRLHVVESKGRGHVQTRLMSVVFPLDCGHRVIDRQRLPKSAPTTTLAGAYSSAALPPLTQERIERTMPNFSTARKPPAMRLAASGPAHHDALCEMLDGAELCAGLVWEEVSTLSRYVTAHEADAGYELFAEGTPGGSLYVLISGRVETRKEDESSHRNVISVESGGRSIGEMALIDGEPRSASCVVTEPAVLLCLTRDNFRRLGEQHAALALHLTLRIARQMSRRLRATSGQLVEYLEG